MSKHTPGPWRVDPKYPGDVQVADGSMEIAKTFNLRTARARGDQYDWPETREESVANAALIAAAPEMLEAHERDVVDLGFLLRAIEEGDHTDELRLRISDILRRKASVFAKARGE